MPIDKVMASAILKSRTGLSAFRDARKLSLSRIDDFRPKANSIDQTVNLLTQAGFTIEAQTGVGVSFSGPAELFETEFRTKLRERRVTLNHRPENRRELRYVSAGRAVLNSPRIQHLAEGVQMAIPGVPFHLATPPAPSPSYYFLNVLNDVPARLNVAVLHALGITGSGIRVSMVDTGFVTRVTETHTSSNTTHVNTDHAIRHVKGVWLSSDPGHAGVNYFTGGGFTGSTITLGTALPAGSTSVQIVYSCLHPHYLAQGYNIDDLRAVGGLDVNTDEYGHGTAEAANVLAVAPGCTFSFVKYSDGGWGNFPLAGFQAAVQNQSPQVVTCSWGTFDIDNALLLEIANAVANGIVVVYSAGNGHTDDPGDVWNAKVVSHPSLISVGGAYPISGTGFRASNYASSFDSFVYTNPQRHCPDVVGLCGELPKACLIMLPTEPSDDMDNDISGSGAFPNGDNTATNDGWVVCSGTSAAAPQTAGVVALLLQNQPGLTPMAVKNILENSACDVSTGSSNSSGPDTAGAGWDPATGFGLIDGQAALNFLQPATFNAYLRDSIEDNATEPVVADRLCASPDIIVRNEMVDDPQSELGQTVKHRDDLSDNVEDGQDNYVYVRMQNRGAFSGSCTATVYFTDPGMFANPASWTNIGQVTVDDLQPGEFRVAGPITWNAAAVPGSGHYCLIGILDSASDPAPDLNAVHSVGDFINMVRDKNNVAWKNIDVEDVIPGGASSYSFYMEGPQGSGHQADLRVDLSNFPATANVVVKMVKRLVDTAVLDHMEVVVDPAVPASTLHTTLKHQGGIGKVESMDFKSNDKTKVTIYYAVPAGAADGNYSIVATLLVDGNATGSYSKIVNVTHFAFVGNRHSLEVHRRDCPWVAKMSPYNKLPFSDAEVARRRGFDNCATCIGGSKR